MMKDLLFAATASLSVLASVNAQVVLEPPDKTIKVGKEEITCIAISPKGDRLLVGTADGADVMDIGTGKRVYHFPFKEDESTVVYHVLFNDNGEFAMLAGFTGKREVYDMKTGKQDRDLALYKWLPTSLDMKKLNLKTGNSPFDRYYQQLSATHGEFTAKADKNGTVVFTDKNAAAVQTLKYPENKDQHHRAPCLFTEEHFITGTDDGRVLYYKLR
jgi:WD40 repeat protein